MRFKFSRIALSLTASAFGIGYIVFTLPPATPTKNGEKAIPTVTCLTETPTPGQKPLCPKRDRHDICHFGKIEHVKGPRPHTRYNVFCEPSCVEPGTTCWVTGLPPTTPSAPYTINWLGAKDPTTFSYNVGGQPFFGTEPQPLLEAVFTR